MPRTPPVPTPGDQPGPAPSAGPPRVATATNPALLVNGSDHALRTLIYDLFIVGEQLTEVRNHLGARLGLTGPQFNLLTAVHQAEDDTGVSVGEVAEILCVSGSFVTTESRKLASKGLLEKQPDPRDARVTRVRLTAAGNAALASVIPEMQKINDLFFGLNDAADFEALRHGLDRLSKGGTQAVGYIRGTRQVTRLDSSMQAHRQALQHGTRT